MATVKMGMTIEEAAECSGIGRNTLERFMTVNPGRILLVRDDVRGVE